MNAKHGLASFGEHFGESALACLLTMVQADVLSVTLGHWAIASRTGVIAGAVASVAVGASRVQHPWVVSTLVGATTAGADLVVHPGQFGPVAAEAVVTGAAAAALTYAVRRLARRFGDAQRRRCAPG